MSNYNKLKEENNTSSINDESKYENTYYNNSSNILIDQNRTKNYTSRENSTASTYNTEYGELYDISHNKESHFTTFDISTPNSIDLEFPNDGVEITDTFTKKIGKCFVYFYTNGMPLVVIGPDCKFALILFFRWFLYFSYSYCVFGVCEYPCFCESRFFR